MADRIVTDTAGRVWTCVPELNDGVGATDRQGRDVLITCATPSVAAPVGVTVGWQWEKMASTGLARLVSQASPVPKN